MCGVISAGLSPAAVTATEKAFFTDEAGQLQKARAEPRRLAKRQAKEHLNCQAGLDGGVVVDSLPDGAACQGIDGSNRTASDPRSRNDAL